MTEQQRLETIEAVTGPHNAQLRESLRANAHNFEKTLAHFYRTPLSGEKRDRLEVRFDEMDAFHREHTGESLFDENPVRVSKQKVIDLL